MPFRFRLGRDPYAVAPTVALAAVTISFVKTSGCETMEAWEAETTSIVAVARSAMKRCVAGGIALSSAPTRYHEGIDFHAGGPDGALSAAALHGRWVAAMTLSLIHI